MLAPPRSWRESHNYHHANVAKLGGPAIGSFYAQHNSQGIVMFRPEEWTYFKAALQSASFMDLGPAMNWFLGNIGYHHVHHLNPGIPFYRLPEAMAAIPELQHPTVTSLAPREIVACFRSNLWDERRCRMVSYREATRA